MRILVDMDDVIGKLTHREIILSVILLKPGNGNFVVEDLKKGLDSVVHESPRLDIPWSSISNTLFFYHPYLCGELNLPEYRLSYEGRKIIQKEFDTYSPKTQQRLREITEKVWHYFLDGQEN